MRDSYQNNLEYVENNNPYQKYRLQENSMFEPILKTVSAVVGRVGVDVILASAMVLSCLVFAYAKHLPIVIPSSDSTAFVGMHYIYPFLAVAILGPGMAFKAKMSREVFFRQIVRAMLCYACILYVHFMFKLWTPHINSVNYDDVFWMTDQKMHWLVEAFSQIRIVVFGFIPYSANFYMFGFIAMFYIGLIWQVKNVPQHVRELLIACMIMQILGTIGYLLAPAVGPFQFERGVNPLITVQQTTMMDFYRQSMLHGVDWLQANGAHSFTAGLGAMPSLHVAGATLFFLNARRHSRVLSILFGFILVYIVVTSVAARWHYLVDLPFGAAIAWISLKSSEKLVRLEIWAAQDRPQYRPALA